MGKRATGLGGLLLLVGLACAPGDTPDPPTTPAAAEVEARRRDVSEDMSNETATEADGGGSASATQPPLPPAPASPEDFERLAQPLRCQRAIRCGERGRSELERCLAEDPLRPLELLGVRRGLAAGRYTYDPEAAARCLALLARAPCVYDPATVPHGCLAGAVPSHLRPAVPPGGACERWEECVAGYCAGDLGCPGTCVAHTPEVGGPCGPDLLCADGLFCDHSTCRRRGEVGESCHAHWQGCRDGLVCKGYRPATDDPHWPSPGDPGTCAEPLGVGDRCGRGRGLVETCRRDLFCDFGDASPSCRARLPAGATCTWLDACAEGLSCAGLRLGEGPSANGSGMRPVTAAGTCVAFGDAGDPCDPDAIVTACPSAQRCDPELRICVADVLPGERCGASSECPYGHYCDKARRTCAPMAAIGEACRPGASSVDDTMAPCFLGECDRKTKTCGRRCSRR